MKNIKLILFSLSIFALLFACKGVGNNGGKTGNNNGSAKEAKLVLKELIVKGGKARFVEGLGWQVELENEKTALVPRDITATFDCGKDSDEVFPISRISYEWAIKVDKYISATLYVKEEKGKNEAWSEKIEVKRKPNENPAPQTTGELKLESLSVHEMEVKNLNDLDNLQVSVADTLQSVSISNIKYKFTLNGNAQDVTLKIEGKAEGEIVLLENEETKIVLVVAKEEGKWKEWKHELLIKKVPAKDIDSITQIIVAKDAGHDESFGFLKKQKPISKLKDGNTTIEVALERPELVIIINAEEGGQPKAEIKLNDVLIDANFRDGSNRLEVKTLKLNNGLNSIKIKTSKPGYKEGNYYFNLNYIPSLTFQELSVNGKKYETLSEVEGKSLTLKAKDADPITLLGKVKEEGATVKFEKQNVSTWDEIAGSSISIEPGKSAKLRMCAEKAGYKTLYIEFEIERQGVLKAIKVVKIVVDKTEVQSGGTVEIEKAKPSVKLVLTLQEKVKDITFKIDDRMDSGDFDLSGTVATILGVKIKADAETHLKLHAEALGYDEWNDEITVKHTTKTETLPATHIVGLSMGYINQATKSWAYVKAEQQANGNWEGGTGSNGHSICIYIDKKDKDLTPDNVKVSVENAKTHKVYFEKEAVKTETTPSGWLEFTKDKNAKDEEFHLERGESDLLITIYYMDGGVEKILEQFHYIVTVRAGY